MLRRLAWLDRLDAEHGLGASPSVHRPPPRRRRGWGGLLVTCLTVLLLVGLVVGPLNPVSSAVHNLVGLGPRGASQHTPDQSGPGHYAFMHTQPGGSEPVAYDPCRRIEIQVNPAQAPADYRALVQQAIKDTAGATGLHLVLVGSTVRRPVSGVSSSVGSLPVLVSWATPAEVPGLAGDVAGLGGSASFGDAVSGLHYATGQVTLDTGTFASLASNGDRGRAEAQAILDHEFGHLVGLAHVHDPHELMNAHVGLLSYGPGDLEGLARLGQGRCF